MNCGLIRLVTALLLVIVGPSLAQNDNKDRPRDHGPMRFIGDSIRQLDLSPRQREQVAEIFAKFRAELDELRKELGTMNPRDARNVVREFGDRLAGAIEDVLDKSQRPDFNRLLDQRRERRRDARGDTQGPQQPTTRPGQQSPAAPGSRGLQPRLEAALTELDLTQQQREQVDVIFSDTREAIAALRRDNQNAQPEQLREKAREIMRQTRARLHAVLTEEQRTRLREKLAPPPGDRPNRGDRGNRGDGSDRDRPDEAPPHESPPGPRSQVDSTDPPAPGPAYTQAAPRRLASFDLLTLGGRPLSDRTLAGKPAVLVFASYTSPTFRDRLPRLKELAQQYRFVRFVIIYTAEAHPAGQWDVQRNLEADISVPPHADLHARFAAARAMRDALQIDFEIAPDDMDDALSNALSPGTPGAVVVDATGLIVAKQKWVEPTALQTHLEGLRR